MRQDPTIVWIYGWTDGRGLQHRTRRSSAKTGAGTPAGAVCGGRTVMSGWPSTTAAVPGTRGEVRAQHFRRLGPPRGGGSARWRRLRHRLRNRRSGALGHRAVRAATAGFSPIERSPAIRASRPPLAGQVAATYFPCMVSTNTSMQYDAELGPPLRNTVLWLKVSYPFFRADRIHTRDSFSAGTRISTCPSSAASRCTRRCARAGCRRSSSSTG